MKTGTILKHYLPCVYFILLAICIIYFTYSNTDIGGVVMRNNIALCLGMIILFSGLLFFRRTYARMAVGLIMLFLSLYFSLAWFDAMVDLRTLGVTPGTALRSAIWFIAGAFCMSILLIIPLHLPARAPLYNRK